MKTNREHAPRARAGIANINHGTFSHCGHAVELRPAASWNFVARTKTPARRSLRASRTEIATERGIGHLFRVFARVGQVAGECEVSA